MLQLAAIKKRLATIKGQMTKIGTFIETITDNTSIDLINARLVRAHDMLQEFISAEDKLFLIEPTENSDMAAFEEGYYMAVAKLNECIRKRSISNGNNADSSFNATHTSPHGEMKLPKMNIPVFTGDYMEWQSFFDLFTKTIHENGNLNGAQKLQYLKSLVRGDAAALLKHFSVTDANYIEALQLLKKRFDRKKYTINAFVGVFLKQPRVTQADPCNVRKMLDTSEEVIRGLKALGSNAESRDPWLIYILLEKLDSESKHMWAQETTSKDNPTLDEFFEFLAKRSDALYTSGIKPAGKKLPSNSQATNSLMASSESPSCPLCEEKHHPLWECAKFNEMHTENRRQFIKESNRCFNCLSNLHNAFNCRSRRRCQTCRKKHHSSLHMDVLNNTKITTNKAAGISSSTVLPEVLDQTSNQTNTIENAPAGEISEASNDINNMNCFKNVNVSPKRALLPTVLLHAKDKSGGLQQCRAVIDCCSESSFITEACVRKLHLPRKTAKVLITGLGQTGTGTTRGITTVTLSSLSTNDVRITLDPYIVPKITLMIPRTELDLSEWHHLRGLQLADPNFNTPGNIDILIGAEYALSLFTNGKVTGRDNQPIAINTLFGWVVSGKLSQPDSIEVCHTAVALHTEIDINNSLRMFWETEELKSPTKHFTQEEVECEQHFVGNTVRNDDGRFVVRLPFKSEEISLGDSYQIAAKRFQSLEKRFQRDQGFCALYNQFMREYLSLGHMEEVSEDKIIGESYYLPHHGVLKETSTTTKLRVVFDASCKTTSGNSLNDKLLVGAVVQQSLYQILVRFRKHKIVLNGDIEKMYRQILIAPEHQRYQMILWRENTNLPLKRYQLKTITYGTSSAPFLATRVLHQIAKDSRTQFPDAAGRLDNDVYVDDLMTGADNLVQALHIKEQLVSMLSGAGFHLRKWTSNHPAFLESIPAEEREITLKEITENSRPVKLLGLHWNPTDDRFVFKVKLDDEATPTKRQILSESARIFDPLEWITPASVRIKILFQRLWLEKLDWDDPLPSDIRDDWFILRNEFKLLEQIQIPRWLSTKSNSSIQLHGFADASKDAYAAVVYSRTMSENGKYITTLVSSKSRVAPLKQESIPRLELCAAVLLTELLKAVRDALDLEIEKIVAWTDSMMVLDWLSSTPRRWDTYVANRTSQILSTLSRNNWRHVPSSQNAADCASRGTSPRTLTSLDLWWKGPNWLAEDECNWPDQRRVQEDVMTMNVLTEPTFIKNLIARQLRWINLLKIVSYVKRFAHNSRVPLKLRRFGTINPTELNDARTWVIKEFQQEYLQLELTELINKKYISKKNSLKTLNCFVDRDGIIRVGGRLKNAAIPYSAKHPIVIPDCDIANLILHHLHIEHHHIGLTSLIFHSRQAYWIVGVSRLAQQVVRKCVICTRNKAVCEKQLMGELPSARLEFVRAFLKVGVDYAGPFLIHLRRGRGQKTYKMYVCVFVCMSTKAVHLEVVSELTTDAFLGALKRFMNKRGICSDIYSDNGTNFVGAARKLSELFDFIKANCKPISEFLLKKFVTWHFNPPGAPHAGGLWEAAVRAMKYHLRRSIGQRILTLEEMITLLSDVEAILNSRPISVLSSQDIDALTPAHFIIFQPLTQLPEVDLTDVKENRLNRWQLVTQLSQHFWTRWSTEYLTSLQKRTKWQTVKENIQIGDIVIIRDEHLPQTHWLLGRIELVHPGEDGLVRVVSIRTKGVVIKRPIQKVCKLPVESSDPRPAGCSSSGKSE